MADVPNEKPVPGPDDPHDDRPLKTDDPTLAPETLGIDDTDTALAPEDASAPVE